MTTIFAQSLSPQTGWIIVIGLGLIWIALGVIWGRKAKTSEGFMLAGRNVGLALGSATAMATWVTSNTLMVAPALALEKGVWGMLAYSSAAFGLMLFAPLAVRIKRLLPEGFTAGDFFRRRYGTFGWVVFMAFTLLYSLTWLVTMAIAGGKLLEALGGIPYVQGMSLILVVCVLYTLLGGLFAVIGTDFIQSVVILLGVVLIGGLVLFQLDFTATYDHVAEYQPMLLDVLMPVALLAFFNNMLFGFGEVFHNNVWWSRAFAMREKVAGRAFFLSGILWFPIPIAAGFLALAAGPLGINVTDATTVGPVVAEHVLGATALGWFAGVIILIILFCSIASSIDSLLAATSDLVVKDVFVGFLKIELNDQNFRRIASTAIVGIGLVSWIIALPAWPVHQVLYSAGGLVASLIWPVIAGLFWERVNPVLVIVGALAGCVAGYYCNFMVGWWTAALVGAAVSMMFTLAARWVPPTVPVKS